MTKEKPVVQREDQRTVHAGIGAAITKALARQVSAAVQAVADLGSTRAAHRREHIGRARFVILLLTLHE